MAGESFSQINDCLIVAAGIDIRETLGSDQPDDVLIGKPRNLALIFVLRVMRTAARAWSDTKNAIRRGDIELFNVDDERAFVWLCVRVPAPRVRQRRPPNVLLDLLDEVVIRFVGKDRDISQVCFRNFDAR